MEIFHIITEQISQVVPFFIVGLFLYRKSRTPPPLRCLPIRDVVTDHRLGRLCEMDRRRKPSDGIPLAD